MLSKALVLYVFAPERSTYQCEVCAYFFEGKCSQYKKDDNVVAKIGSCNLWDSNEAGAAIGTGLRTKASTGYVENEVGMSCGRCEEFVPDTKRCKKVNPEGGPNPGFISPLACCSRWEKDPVRGDLPEKALRSMKSYR